MPLNDGRIADHLRVDAAVPTLRWLLDQGAEVTAITHLGRPQPAKNFDISYHDVSYHDMPYHDMSYCDTSYHDQDTRFSVAPIRQHLQELVQRVKLAENLRFNPGEVANDNAFVKQLVSGHDAYVNDAFGVSHRVHASIVGPPRFLPSAAGKLLASEVAVLEKLKESPRRPFVVMLGGSKIIDKLNLLRALGETADALIIGGGMCFTFLKAQGHSVGASVCENAMIEHCQDLMDAHKNIYLPCDFVALSPDGKIGALGARGETIITGKDLPDGWTGADIGPKSARKFADIINDAGTVLWNGPMGVFEDHRFAEGTESAALALADTQAFTVVGGGDSAAAVRRFGVAHRIDHISTGGGAALEFIEKGDLPGLIALRKASNYTRNTQ